MDIQPLPIDIYNVVRFENATTFGGIITGSRTAFVQINKKNTLVPHQENPPRQYLLGKFSIPLTNNCRP